MLMLIGWGEEVEKFSLCLLFLKIDRNDFFKELSNGFLFFSNP